MLLSFICSVMCSSAIRFVGVTDSKDKNQQFANLIIDNLSPGACIYLMENGNADERMSWRPYYVYKLESSQVDDAGRANVQVAMPPVKENHHYAFRLNNGANEEVYSKPFVYQGGNNWAPSRSDKVEQSLNNQASCSGAGSSTKEGGAKGGAATAKKGSKSTSNKKGKKKSKKSTSSAKSVVGSLAAIVTVAASIMVL